MTFMLAFQTFHVVKLKRNKPNRVFCKVIILQRHGVKELQKQILRRS